MNRQPGPGLAVSIVPTVSRGVSRRVSRFEMDWPLGDLPHHDADAMLTKEEVNHAGLRWRFRRRFGKLVA